MTSWPPRNNRREVNVSYVDEVEAFDRELVIQLKEGQARIQEEGRLADHTISQVRIWRVILPWTGTKRWDESAVPFTFGEFETDRGLVGVCDRASPDLEALRERVVGRNAFDPAIRADLGSAYWDLAGKIADKPLWQYLRDIFDLETPEVAGVPVDFEHIPVSAYTWYRFPDVNGEHEVTFDTYPQYLREEIRAHGFRVIKLSMCDFEPLRYIELVHDIRDALGPEVEIRVDPHASWSESQALRFMKATEDCNLEWIEEPVGGRFENMWRAGHRLRQMSSIPISSHAWLPPLAGRSRSKGRYVDGDLDIPLNLKAIRRYQPADVSAPDAGCGPLALKRYCDTARFMGMDISMHSGYELGPDTAIRLHFAAFAFPYSLHHHINWGRPIAPFALHAIDSHYNQFEGDVIRGGHMPYEQGCLRLPSGPGLGVELDPDLMEQHRLTPEIAELHTRHIEAVRGRHMDELGWRHNRMGWHRIRSDPG